MKAQELELWTRDIVSAVLANQPVEDSKVELKSVWFEPGKAAHRLAAHANAARGVPILWLIGVDEKNHALTNADPVELENWYKSVQRFFDGFAPRLLVDVNVRIGIDVVVALYFETEREAPYVVTNLKGGYPDFIVPWREGTRLRAARRDDLLRLLVPIRRFSALIDELDYNIAIAGIADSGDYYAWGAPFREEEFHRALRDGAIGTLPAGVKQLLFGAYVTISRANQRVIGALNTSMAGSPGTDKSNQARGSVIDSLPQVKGARDALVSFMK